MREVRNLQSLRSKLLLDPRRRSLPCQRHDRHAHPCAQRCLEVARRRLGHITSLLVVRRVYHVAAIGPNR